MFTGFVIGLLLGLAGMIFNYIKNPKVRILSKAAYCAITAILAVIVARLSTFKESMYIGSLFFGYGC